MNTPDAIVISEAAKQLGVGSRRLYAELRQRGVLDEQNRARLTFIDKGFFKVVNRNFKKSEYEIPTWYTVTLVTGTGMSFLKEVVDGMDTNEQVLHPKRRGVSH